MKIIHTAGWLLGLELPAVPLQANRLRQARLETVERILALAEHERADAVVVAGNVFADNRIDTKTVLSLAERLSRSRVPVYLLPGLWDPYTSDSPYRRFQEKLGPPVRILTEPVRVGDVTLLPLPALRRNENLDWDFLPPTEGRRVVVACCPADEVPADVEADYLALGSEPGPVACGAGWYPGTPEPTDFGQSGRALVVEVESKTVTPRDVSGHSWVDVSREVHTPDHLESFENELMQLPRPLSTLVRIHLTGTLPELGRVDDLEGRLAARFLHVQLRNEVTPSEMDTPLLKSLAERVLASGDDPDVIRRALRKLGRR